MHINNKQSLRHLRVIITVFDVNFAIILRIFFDSSYKKN